ncbi:MAG: glycine--tRNA ligase subunit beta [Deltaproteobacteria bacterium]|nr:glycine--tRNA ligase subunit beta [Deltaproteobacteria bacterium]MBW1931878.1 glycine--tRNA ligase subunit beta [Deltaproteobacteria bacterium]MBW1937532.1 glycine--tRNA ligase subunit beta [Deltaproteobacteria bacterium]MBW1964108.1 glycine--tRNA ligase subunit beta [Deltaproteobacteria bacterium]MBW2079414.1 glycine--tRNA ligase subunit beta [Deltaproteobacteria bacterium]
MNTRNLLLEIGTEEIPAAFISGALDNLALLAGEHLDREHLTYEDVSTIGTPRRLVLFAKNLPDRQPDREEIVTGPPAKVAFLSNGKPTKAGEGFARSHGVRVEDLQVEDTEKGLYIVIRRIVHGRDTIELLSELLPLIIAAIPFPKTMRWGTEDLRFARPIRWLVALYGEDIVPFILAGVETGFESRGHRFMAPEAIRVSSNPEGYIKALEGVFVLADPSVRRDRLLKEARDATASVGGNILSDDELVDINTYLTEFPSAVCGSFDKRFLALPRDVLITSMREHQKYFAVVDDKGDLMPHFVAINNTRSPRSGLVRKGHERVIRARLSDADFFFKEDLKRPLEAFVGDLSGMIFHQRLGTVLDKIHRVKALAHYLAEQVAQDKVEVVDRAAWLCKADLLTEMVGEFPSLQGIIGREYALLSGESQEVANAIEEHYMPVRSGGKLPGSLPGALLSIADKMDTICGTIAIGLKPSGTADPYGLRRLALGVLHIMEERSLSLSLKALIVQASHQLENQLSEVSKELTSEVVTFFKRRFSYDLTARGMDHDVVEAATRVEFDDVKDCVLRVSALASVRSRPEFEPLSVAFKRVMNILKGFEGGIVNPLLLETEEEKALYEVYLSVEKKVAVSFESRDYEQALVTLLSLKPQVDSFFDHVMVMTEDIDVRANRLALLWNIACLFSKIGDLSAIVVSG